MAIVRTIQPRTLHRGGPRHGQVPGPIPPDREEEYRSKHAGGHKALVVMNDHLNNNDYFVGNRYTITDLPLCAYTHVAHEVGFDRTPYDAILTWMERLAAHPPHLTMDQTSTQIPLGEGLKFW